MNSVIAKNPQNRYNYNLITPSTKSAKQTSHLIVYIYSRITHPNRAVSSDRQVTKERKIDLRDEDDELPENGGSLDQDSSPGGTWNIRYPYSQQ